jgi:sec-independent protein translocase protein TatC
MTLSVSYFFIDKLFYIFTNFFFIIEETATSGIGEISIKMSPTYEKDEIIEFEKALSFSPSAEWKTEGQSENHGALYKKNQYESRKFIFTDITEAFRTSLSLAIGFTCYIHVPFLIYQIWSFFVPSLFCQERQKLSRFCFLLLFLYFLATFSIISLIFPVLWNFFLNFETTTEFLDIHCEARISSYISFIFKTCLLSHFIFQLPFFSLLFLEFQVFSIFDIMSNRRFIYWCILLLSALTAPPDFLIQFFISFFLILLLEIGFFILLLFTKYALGSMEQSRAFACSAELMERTNSTK